LSEALGAEEKEKRMVVSEAVGGAERLAAGAWWELAIL